jgi:hypothetical protein
VGDIFMSLIHTCELNGINPFDYLTEIERPAKEAAAEPARWMPWNYQETLAEIATASAADTASPAPDAATSAANAASPAAVG